MPAKPILRTLAVFGGPPLFPHPVGVGKPNLPERAALFARFQAMLDSGWLTNNGPAVPEFERRIADILQVKHCIACSSATAGLQLAARALDLKGEVILPSFTFIGTAHALSWLGLEPVFCDIDSSTYCIDPGRVEALITPRTSAILGVHLWGRACPVEELVAIADRNRLKLLFDAAHALGCTYRNTPIGGFGNAEVFSFHATKVINTFEGGIVATNDGTLADRLQRTRNYGFNNRGVVVCQGTNAKMSEAHASMGLACLDEMPMILERNRNNYAAYDKVLCNIPGIRLISHGEATSHNYHYVIAEIDATVFGLHRDELAYILTAEGILARRYFHPGCHRSEPYCSRPVRQQLPCTEALMERALCLPTGLQIRPAEIESIGAVIRFCAENAPEIRKKLAEVGVAEDPVVPR
jgi:dTDP-4-amino-4,6-dideoxyglucose